LSDTSIAREVAAGLDDEGRLFSRYLVGRDAPPGLLRRYAEAVERLALVPRARPDAALLRFVRRHPSSLPLLDAAVAVVRRESVLRARLLLMLALLEATVDQADDFLPRPRGRASAVARVALEAAIGACKTAGGLLILPLATRGR